MTRHLPNDDDISAFRQALQAAGVRRIATNQADPGKPKRQTDASEARRRTALSATNPAPAPTASLMQSPVL
jgi:hypothetical protein